ncbi:MAG: YdcF family protein [Bacteroidota bacterium]
MPRRARWRIAGGLVVLLLLFGLRGPLLRGLGGFLVVEDPAERCDAIFVLSGNAQDRGQEAARLYHAGYAPTVVCLGGESNPALELYGIFVSTAEITRSVLQEAQVPEADIELLEEGTSTYEEFVAISEWCHRRSWDKIMVVSSRFHTRRIHAFFRLRLHFSGIQMVLRGARDRVFEEETWWKSEPGLIFVNNEYVKLLYYWLKY